MSITVDALLARVEILEKQVALLTKSDKKAKLTEKSDKPKKTKISGYILFSKENRETVKNTLGDDAKSTAIMQELGKWWKDLSHDEKNVWNEKAKQMKLDTESTSEEESTPMMVKDSPDESNSSEKPKKKRVSGYILFTQTMRDDVKESMASKSGDKVKNQDVMVELGKMWKQLSEDEKTVWNDKAKEDN